MTAAKLKYFPVWLQRLLVFLTNSD